MYLYFTMCLRSVLLYGVQGHQRHSLNLAAHGQGEEDAEVNKQDGPVDRDVSRAGDRAGERNDDGLGRRVPELELCLSACNRMSAAVHTWEATDEGAELLVVVAAREAREEATDAIRALGALRARQARRALLDVVGGEVGSQRRIKARLEEREEQVEDVDAQRVWRQQRHVPTYT